MSNKKSKKSGTIPGLKKIQKSINLNSQQLDDVEMKIDDIQYHIDSLKHRHSFNKNKIIERATITIIVALQTAAIIKYLFAL